MTKQEQININESIVSMYDYICKYAYRSSHYCNFRNCKAKTFTVTDKATADVLGVGLVSYNTLVAFIDEDGVCYDFLRYVWGYSATSAQHIAKFKHDYQANTTFTYRPV